jgi:predicted peptidase
MRMLLNPRVGILIWLLAGTVMSALAGEPQLQRVKYHSNSLEADREYWLYLPKGYDPDSAKRWPVLMFLHGGGERGNQLELVLRHGPIMEVVIKRRDLPFIIIAPQMPEMSKEEQQRREERRRQARQDRTPRDGPDRQSLVRIPSGKEPRWGSLGPPEGWSKMEDDLLRMIDDTLKEHRADADRVYLTGLSYGGFGTWYMATHHPDRWAAVAPICGAGQNDQVHLIKNLPVWLIQGGRDEVVRAEWTLATADALDKSGGNVRVTVHEDLQHDSWSRAYGGQDLYDWFLSHHR